MRLTTPILAGSLLSLIVLWMMWPSPITSTAWIEPEPPVLTGNLAPDSRLDSAEILPVHYPGIGSGLTGISGEQALTTSLHGVRRLDLTSGGSETIYATDGWRITTIANLSEHRLAVACVSGVYSLDLDTLQISALSSGYNARPLGFVNDLAVEPDGTIYFTDSSTRWGHESEGHNRFFDFLENQPTGVLYRINSNNQITELVADRLYYPNGLVVVENGRDQSLPRHESLGVRPARW